MNMQQIRYIVEIDRHNSFSIASQTLFISQPRLSQAVRELEKELGFDIFERNRKGIIGPTVKGYEFLLKAKQILKDFEELSDFSVNLENYLKVTTTLIPQAQDTFIETVLKHKADMELNADLFFCGCFESADKVANTDYDLGIVTILDNQFDDWMHYFESIGLEYHELVHAPVTISVSRNSPLSEYPILKPADLKEYLYVTEKCSKMNNLTMEVYSTFDSLFSTPRVTVSNTDIMYSIVAEGNAFTLDSIYTDSATQKKYNIISVPFKSNLRVHTGYIKKQNRCLNLLYKDYIGILTEKIKS